MPHLSRDLAIGEGKVMFDGIPTDSSRCTIGEPAALQRERQGMNGELPQPRT